MYVPVDTPFTVLREVLVLLSSSSSLLVVTDDVNGSNDDDDDDDEDVSSESLPLNKQRLVLRHALAYFSSVNGDSDS